MGNVISDQLVTFLRSILLGGTLALLYDLFRSIRSLASAGTPGRRRSHFRLLLGGLLDAVYCFIALAAVFFFVMAGDGELRLFILAGILGGAVLFFCLLSPLLLPLWRFWLGIFLVPPALAIKFSKKLYQICKKLFSFLKSWFTIMFTSIGGRRARPPEGGDTGNGQDNDPRQTAAQQ